MKQGKVSIFSGSGKGKSAAALGRAMQEASQGKDVVIITFLKEIGFGDFLKRLEPEIKVFRFEKCDTDFEELSEERKKEEIFNIRNGLNFARKVLCTGEYDLVVLDEILGIIDNGIITSDEVSSIIDGRSDEVDLILTGRILDEGIAAKADEISVISSGIDISKTQ